MGKTFLVLVVLGCIGGGIYFLFQDNNSFKVSFFGAGPLTSQNLSGVTTSTIKNIETNKYLYIDYNIDKLVLSSDKKIIFEINKLYDLKNNKNNIIYEILLGIFYLTKFNCKGLFRNENLVMQCLKDINERMIIFDEIDSENICYIKFLKYNNYLSINKNIENTLEISKNKETKWKLEKVEIKDKIKNKFIKVRRYLKDNKYYYQNIENNEIYTNYYLGWGYENILDNN
jgi:hypothetical protein